MMMMMTTTTMITTSTNWFPRAASSSQAAASPRSGYQHILPSLAIVRLVFFLLLLISSNAWEKRQTSHGKSIIAYYASWQMYDREGLAKPSNLDHSKVTRYNFAFFQTNADGDIWGTDDYADPIVLYGEINWNWLPGQPNSYCSWTKPGQPPYCQGHRYETGLIYQAHKAGVEVYISIGGWTLSNTFSSLAQSSTARKQFAQNCVMLIETYDIDGIDIDWEYPGYAEHMGTPADTQNYSLLLQEIRNALGELGRRKGRVYGLTAALPCSPDLMNNIEIGEVSYVLTELNLMTYDFYGTWDKRTGPNAPLYDMGGGSSGFSVHSCVENWKAGGGRADQINIGLPFYGRSFAGRGLTKFGQANDGTADIITWRDDEGSPQYYNIASKISGFTSGRDTQTMTQYAYNDYGFVSYDDERATCDKTEYAMDQELSGYIIWEISGDLMPDLSTPLLDAANNRLNTNVRCRLDPNFHVTTLGPSPSPTPLPTATEGYNPTPMPSPQVLTPKPTEMLTSSPTTQPSLTQTSSPTHNDTATIITPKEEDILFGKGSNSRNNPGNMRLREIVDEYRPIYNQVLDVNKPSISEMIVNIVRNATPPSRFLRLSPVTSRWEELGARRSVERVDQMLRKGANTNTGVVAAKNTTVVNADGEANGGMMPTSETAPVLLGFGDEQLGH